MVCMYSSLQVSRWDAFMLRVRSKAYLLPPYVVRMHWRSEIAGGLERGYAFVVCNTLLRCFVVDGMWLWTSDAISTFPLEAYRNACNTFALPW